ncbi:hypothetical protein BGX26_009950 [Mortierella sp. AD094]|nr:hypothetical protein BGX26_009950 [Mortierella sp. AD094]
MSTATPSPPTTTTVKKYKIVFFVPENSKELVKERLFAIGAGRDSKYDKCSFETSGIGQFRPLKESRPYIGEEGVLEKVPEYRVEMLCKEDIIRDAIRELISAHPYEEPAYEVYEILNLQ